MENVTLEILNMIYNGGYEAYAVGGFVRDKLLGIKSNDIDVTTNATPMELKNIFPTIKTPKESYGSVTLVYKNVRFEITTYRKEHDYLDNRHPDKIEYVNDLKTDLLRRDFTINAICMDRFGNIVDLLGGTYDLEKHLIRTIDNSVKSFSNDTLRILRAIRFATTLKFTMSDEVIKAIGETKNLLINLSCTRKKYELDHIFASSNALDGVKLLKELDLIDLLEIHGIDRVKDFSDIIGIWAMINPLTYNFTSSEKDLIKKINLVYNMNNLDKHVLYKYGLYVNVLAALNKGVPKKKVIEIYHNLPINTRDDINITATKMCEILNRKPSSFIDEIYCDLENKIIDNELENNEIDITNYILNKS